ncbi:unnamed protein product [marine sediment metagenome]|uniref:Uncharacterized protein n=1 Tax=marine sediment metagenome TaxID=412755 RepID=X1G0W6_9ZZZZ
MKAVNNPDSFTLEKADEVVAYQCDYGMFERINIKGTVNQGSEVSAVTVTGDFFAREWKSEGAANLPVIDVFELNAKLTTLDIDGTWASLGGTPMTATLRAFDIDIITGLHPKMLGSATKDFDVHAEGIVHVTSAFTFEGNANASTEYGNFLTQADRAYRLTISNPATAPAAMYAGPSICQIDCFGRWREVIPFADEDRGNNLFTLIHESMLDPTNIDAAPDMLEILVHTTVNTVA